MSYKIFPKKSMTRAHFRALRRVGVQSWVEAVVTIWHQFLAILVVWIFQRDPERGFEKEL